MAHSPQQHWLQKKLLEIFEAPPATAQDALLEIAFSCAGLNRESHPALFKLIDEYDPKREVARAARAVHSMRFPDARSFLASLLEGVGMPSIERSEIMASLRLYSPLNQVIVHCAFKGCGNHSEPGLLFCAEHLHEAALLDAERARTHGLIKHCAFKGENRDGSIGCSIIFRSLTEDLCPAHRPAPPPPPGPGATIIPLPLSKAPKRSKKVAARKDRKK